MDFKWWVIIILIVLLYFQYTAPEKVKWATDPTLGEAQGFIEKNNPLNNLKTSTCPSTYEPVCGSNGMTYNNTCIAALDKVTSVTNGVC